MKQEITMGSLFSGSGGFELAGSIFGIRPIWASEIEPFPILVTTKNFPEMKHLGDINKLNGADLEPVTIIAGGSPCQDMSIAGKREGLDGSRSNLFREQIRIVKEMRESDRAAGRTGKQIRPRYMVWENVPGAFSSNKGKDFQAVLQEIVSITDEESNVPLPPKGKWQTAGCIMGDHFSIAWRVLDAQYWGVPQRRKRIYLVADFRGQRAGEILLKPEGLRRNSAQSGTHGQETARCAKNSVGTAIGGVDRYNQSFLPGLAQTLRASGGGDRADTAGCNGKGVCEDKCYTLNTIDRHAVCFPQQAYNKFIQEDIGATLKASGGTYGGGSENLVAKQSFSPIRYIVRRLTPTECARLQGFPDWWGEIPKKDNLTDDEYTFWLNVRNTYAKINNKTTKEYSKEKMLSWYNKLHSDSSEYKMWGNGIALPNALYVMQGIAEVVGVHHSK